MDARISDVAEIEGVNSEPNATEAESYRRYVDDITEKVEQVRRWDLNSKQIWHILILECLIVMFN